MKIYNIFHNKKKRQFYVALLYLYYEAQSNKYTTSEYRYERSRNQIKKYLIHKGILLRDGYKSLPKGDNFPSRRAYELCQEFGVLLSRYSKQQLSFASSGVIKYVGAGGEEIFI